MRAPCTFLAACGMTLTLAPTAFAQSRAMNDDSPVTFLSGYLFASGVRGEVSTIGPLPPADIDLSFRDVIEHFDGGAMATAEYRNGRWSVIGDLMYTSVKPTGHFPGSTANVVTLHQRSTTLQGNLLYRAYATPDFRFDIGAGLRYWNLDNTISVTTPPVSGKQKNDWLDPVIAIRLQTRISDTWRATVFADYGGFGGSGSDETWQVIGTFDYAVKENLMLRMGYRMLATDYTDGRFKYDVTMHGPIFGMSYSF